VSCPHIQKFAAVKDTKNKLTVKKIPQLCQEAKCSEQQEHFLEQTENFFFFLHRIKNST